MILLFSLLACKGEQQIVLADSQNYYFVSTISAESQWLAAQEDAVVDWSALDQDLLGSPLDPTADLTTLGLVRFPDLSREEILQGINDDTLTQAVTSDFAELDVAPGQTSAHLTDFALFGTAVVPADNILADSVYLISAITGEDDYRMFGFFEVNDETANAPFLLAGDSAQLAFDVDLAGVEPTVISPDGRVDIDWSELTENGSDLPINLSDIDRMMLARYDEPLSELEADFLQVEQRADAKWTADVEGWGDWYFDDLEGEDGEAFSMDQFSDDGTWLLALQCTTCLNPAPPFLTVVTPE